MSTQGSIAALDLFDPLNIAYEKAYHNNPYKVACIKKATSLLPPNANVLDVGCGTGVPVSSLLVEAGLNVTGLDISPKMIELCRDRIKPATFIVSDMLTYEHEETEVFDAVFVIFSHLTLSYEDFHGAAWKFAKKLKNNGGMLVIGQMPLDEYVPADSPAYLDEAKSVVEFYDAPFMGKDEPTLMMSVEGQLDFLTSMGFDVVSNTVDWFHPDDKRCVPEHQQYVIARRLVGGDVPEPIPLPRRRH